MHTDVCIYIYIYAHKHTHTHTHIYIYIYIYMHTHIYISVRVCVCIYIYNVCVGDKINTFASWWLDFIKTLRMCIYVDICEATYKKYI